MKARGFGIDNQQLFRSIPWVPSGVRQWSHCSLVQLAIWSVCRFGLPISLALINDRLGGLSRRSQDLKQIQLTGHWRELGHGEEEGSMGLQPFSRHRRPLPRVRRNHDLPWL